MRGEARFVQNPYFEEALRFFEIYAETAGGLEAELKFWWQRESEIARPLPQVRGNAPTPHLAANGGAKRPKPSHPHAQPKKQDQNTNQIQAQDHPSGDNAEQPKKRRRRRPRRRKPPGQAQAPQSIQA